MIPCGLADNVGQRRTTHYLYISSSSLLVQCVSNHTNSTCPVTCPDIFITWCDGLKNLNIIHNTIIRITGVLKLANYIYMYISTVSVTRPHRQQQPRLKVAKSSKKNSTVLSRITNLGRWLAHFLRSPNATAHAIYPRIRTFPLPFICWHALDRSFDKFWHPPL